MKMSKMCSFVWMCCSSKEIDLQMLVSGGIDLSTFRSDNKESSGWDVKNITGKREQMPSAEEEPNFAVLMFQINLQRSKCCTNDNNVLHLNYHA